jgi:hypothetical protein
MIEWPYYELHDWCTSMKPLRAGEMMRAVGAARQAVSAALDTRREPIVAHMLNSAGSVSAEWYVEELWHYLAKRSLLQGVSGFDVEFKHAAQLTDKQLLFALPHPEADDLVMDFHVVRAGADARRRVRVPVAHIKIHRGRRRRRHGVAPDPPHHPYGIEIRRRHLNHAKQVSWYTLVAVIMDVARRGAQLADGTLHYVDPSRLYVVPSFSFTPLADAAAQDNLFVYPEFRMEQPWASGKTSAAARVTFWAVANEEPWPIAESTVTVVRTRIIDGRRRPVDETGENVLKSAGTVP